MPTTPKRRRPAKEKTSIGGNVWSRQVVAYWDQLDREHEEVAAQAGYLLALSRADNHRDDLLRRSKRWPKAKRAQEIKSSWAWTAKMVRDATRRIKRPMVPSRHVTGSDMERVIGSVVSAESRLAGLWHGSVTADANTRDYGGPQSRTEYLELRSRDGRTLAVAVVAGAERELLVRLVAALTAQPAPRIRGGLS